MSECMWGWHTPEQEAALAERVANWRQRRLRRLSREMHRTPLLDRMWGPTIDSPADPRVALLSEAEKIAMWDR